MTKSKINRISRRFKRAKHRALLELLKQKDLSKHTEFWFSSWAVMLAKAQCEIE